jgi:formylglycine-generating enzyme required for sulfatase activity
MRRSMILFPWVLSGFISLSGFVARGEPQTELAARLQVDPQLYMVVDLSEGSAASQYPVSYLSAVPAGGWSEEYRTTKMVLRRIPAGTYSMGSPVNELDRQDDETQHEVTLTSSFYIGVYEVTQKQWERLWGPGPVISTTLSSATPDLLNR